MDWAEAEKITKAFEEAYVAAHANQDIEALREGFPPHVEIFLNGRLQVARDPIPKHVHLSTTLSLPS